MPDRELQPDEGWSLHYDEHELNMPGYANPYYEYLESLEQQRAEEIASGTRCGSCGGTDESGYDDCEFLSLECYTPGVTCPRVTGVF